MIITDIEQAIVNRLKQGLGHIARSVSSYGGEMDGEPEEVIRQLPGVWVTFGGVQKTERSSTARNKFVTHGRFVVIVGDRSVRSEEASRTGGPTSAEVGTYRMIAAVRRLLSGQDMAESGLKIDALQPGRVRTLFNTRLEKNAFSVFACEFDTKWMENALENGRYPLVDAPDGHDDSLFRPYHGKTSEDDPEWLRTRLIYDLKNPEQPDAAEDIVNHDPDES
ncbi:hypothetical protein WGA_00754 [Escherichia coli KTE40]|uniref:DUF1834 family protein n=1 Tax=Enterobacteriaceae TaxID=543 RepID=UPI00033E8EF1|nr:MULTISPECIES: DUF1834 family protein [Enterobacteriaceae]EFM3262626.1 DUF1834 family protein [Escherichia coli]ELX8021585.1 DUF1834 family protein [Salmonella enterica subsp. enterica serovar Kentucky]EKD4439712.1 DUF1834 family protein [Escherichia coli]EKW9284523.1 DUF1834 family protein [Citrobacter freundii]ELS9880573.1 DUF1834 family protein [Escherichia coli]